LYFILSKKFLLNRKTFLGIYTNLILKDFNLGDLQRYFFVDKIKLSTKKNSFQIVASNYNLFRPSSKSKF